MPYNSNDNTRVNRPVIQEPIKYKLLPGEVKLPSGLIIKAKLAELSQGSSEPKILRDLRYKELTRLHEYQKLKEREALTMQGLTAPLLLISPSHIIGSANSNKPFLESYLGDSYNSATGNMIGDFALDAVVGGGLWKGAKVAGDLSRAAYSRVIQPGVRFFNSPLTGKWTKFGNREYRLSPNTLGINGGSLESRNILNELPIDENRYYRLVDRDAFDSYKQTGVVSQYTPQGGLRSAYPVPMFSKGKPSSHRLGINDYNKVWVVSKPESQLEWESVKGASMSPKVNGEFNKAPISDFDFYVYNPEKGYIKLDESLNLPGGVTVSRTPHIDYLNSLSKNEQIKYLTDNGLNDLWLWTLENNPDHLESALSKAPIPSISKNPIYFEINPYKYGNFDSSIFNKWMYRNKIMGFPWPYASGLDNSGKAIFSSGVKRGISSEAKKYIMHNTVDRNIREFKLNGYSDAMNQAYKEKANDLFDNVNVGTYSGDDYVNAGHGEMGGFFDYDRNFISINRDSKFPTLFIEKHEARHLLDYNTSMLDSQDKIVSAAYDDDFINIPNTQYAGSLKDYSNMRAERVTTNRDARDRLFDKYAPHMKFSDHHLLDMFIDKMSDDKIFEAVEKANGYGRRFIEFLRDSNKLTPEKAQQFREAMKHVGGIAAPIGIGTALYNQK